MWDPRERETADRVDDFSPRSRDDAREDSFDDDDDDDDIKLDLDLDLAGDVFTNGHESLSPAVGARAMEDDEGDDWDGGSMMREGSDDRGVDRGVRAMSESESDDEDSEDDGAVFGTKRVWSAYDAEAAARVRGEGAMREVEAREREREAVRAEAAARLNARGRPKRGAVLKTQEARREAEKSKTTTNAVEEDEEDEEEEGEEGDLVDLNEDGGEEEENTLSLRMSAAAETVRAETSEAGKGKVNSKSKRQKVDTSTKDVSRSVENVRVLLSSGYSDRQRKDLTKKIKKLGATVVESISDFTVFVTEPPLKRTKNVMASVLRGCPIVKTCWVEKSSKSGNFYPPQKKPFILRDKKFETEHGYDPVSARERNPFAGKTYLFDNVPRGSDPTMTPKGVRTVIEELLSVAGASPACSDADFVIRLRDAGTARDGETRVGDTWYTPSEILAACVAGSLPRAP